MIVSFSVANFRSFSSEETLSLVGSKRLSRSHEDHAAPIPDSKEMVLKAAVIYGANGAGKSNLFKALRYLRRVALEPHPKASGTRREPFRLGERAEEVSSFDVQFLAGGKLYRFGFKEDDRRITQEWLVQIKGEKERQLYERITDENGVVTIEAPNLKGPKLKALTTVGGPQNQSFLATVCATLQVSDFGEDLKNVLGWFQRLTLISPNANYSSLTRKLASELDFLEFSGNFLKASSTGVDLLTIQKSPMTKDTILTLLDKDLGQKVLETIDEDQSGMTSSVMISGNKIKNEIVIEKDEQGNYFRVRVRAGHKNNAGDIIPLELSEESDGTRRLLNLMPALHDLNKKPSVYFIDEIDRSMHPILARRFLEFFLKSCDGDHRQIIVTTHESNLLDLGLLRRDEIWFVEKDATSATRLYSLLDFKVRKDLEIRKGYLEGRFGAIPFLGSIDQLLPEKGGAK
jgi:AAA15 family ATPase/GTPase